MPTCFLCQKVQPTSEIKRTKAGPRCKEMRPCLERQAVANQAKQAVA